MEQFNSFNKNDIVHSLKAKTNFGVYMDKGKTSLFNFVVW